MSLHFFRVMVFSIALAMISLLLIMPHDRTGHIHTVSEGLHHAYETGSDGTHLHRTYEPPTDDLTTLDNRLREGGIPHLFKKTS